MNGNSRGRGWSGKRGSFGKGNYNNGPGEKKFKTDDDVCEVSDYFTASFLQLPSGKSSKKTVCFS